MSDDYIYRDLYRECLNTNMFVKKNTINSIKHRIEWLIEQKLKLDPNHNTYDLEQVIEILRGMND